ncbi:hypothetical protein P1P70_38665, partial [Streptomyces sp. MB09-02B]|nr:hypothetical protein [Streptomyces sp. MB09-02B]
MNTQPDADERRIAQLLRQRGVGPDAEPALVIPPMPTRRPRDWLDDILESNTPPAPKPAPVKEAPAAVDPVPPDDDGDDPEPACTP